MASSNASAIKGAHDAFNSRDWKAMSAVVADDCVWIDGRGQRYDGPDAFANDYSKAWADAFSDAEVTEAQYYDAGDTVVAEFVGRGTHDGQLGPMPATGRRVDVPYVEIYRFNADGKVSSGRAYFDQLALLTQLGQAPAPA
jgi:steroid delta-isomerase-like uncharacterized protein